MEDINRQKFYLHAPNYNAYKTVVDKSLRFARLNEVEEAEGGQSKFKKVLGRGKNFLRVGILAGTIIGSRSNAVADNTRSPDGLPDSGNSQIDNLQQKDLPYHVVAPEISSDEVKEKINEVPFENIMQGIISGFTEAQNITIQNTEEWKQAWEKINKDSNRPLPEIDFSNNIVLLTAQGPQKDNRHAIEIGKIEVGDKTIVEINSYTPSEQCPITPADNSPFQAVTIHNPGKPIEFQTQEKLGCWNIGVASSSRTDAEGHTTYGPQTVTIDEFVP